MPASLSALLDSASYALFATDCEGKISVFNPAAQRLLGYSAKEVVGQLSSAHFHTSEELLKHAAEVSERLGRPFEPSFQSLVALAKDKGLPDERRWTYVRKDGSQVPVMLSITAIIEEGETTGYLSVVRDFSDILHLETQNNSQEKRLLAVFEATVDAMFVIDEHGKITDVNQAGLEIFGYNRGDLVGQNVTMLMSQTDATHHHEYVSRYQESGTPRVIGKKRDVIGRRKGGDEFPCELSVAEVRDGGATRSYVGTLRDLSVQRRVEDERRLLIDVIDETPDFIGMSDLEGRLIYQNRAGNLMVGWEAEKDVRGLRIPELHPRWAAERVKNKGIPHAMTNGTWVGESALLDTDGAEVPVSQVIIAHRDDQGKPKYLSTIMRDLRGERKAERLIGKVMRHVPGIVFQFLMTESGEPRFPYVSEAVERLLGVSAEEASDSAERVLGRIHEEDLERVMADVLQSKESGDGWSSEFRYRHPDGTTRWYYGKSNPERLPNGSTLWHGFLHDISEQIEIREQLQEALALAKKASDVKAQFLATMSHEIRTPLNGVLGMADLLAGTTLDEEQCEFVDAIQSSGSALLILINDILDYSKIEAGKLHLEEVTFSPRQVALEVVQLFSEQASRKGLCLSVEAPDEKDNWVLGDPTRTRQLLLNLVSNAIKFTEKGQVVLGVEVAPVPSKKARSQVSFKITDSGIGMTAEQLANLGKAFTQADASTTRRFGGTGLGLSICYGIVEVMQGTISVRSRYEEGTTFTVSLEFDEISAGPKEPSNADELWGARAKLSRVLVAEDNAMNRRLMSHLLRPLAETVDMVETGLDAVERARTRNYDVILMDGQMPEMDGLEATTRIRELEADNGRRRTPIVAVTANALSGDRERFILAGMDDHLAKPLRRHELINALLRLCSPI